MIKSETNAIPEVIELSFLAGGVIEVLSSGFPVQEDDKSVLNRAIDFLAKSQKGEKAIREFIKDKTFKLTEIDNIRTFKWALYGFDREKLESAEINKEEIACTFNDFQTTLSELEKDYAVEPEKILDLKNFFSLIQDFSLIQGAKPVDSFIII